jgi:hypothetical protein
MTTLTNFFKESDSTLGVFYPKHYIIATFPTWAVTLEAAQALRTAGFSDDEVLAVPASEVLKYFEEFRANSGLWAGVMSTLSRAFGTEQVFADGDIHSAHQGRGFLASYSPDEKCTSRVQELLTPLAPKAMHWYQAGCVETLV